MINVLIGSFSIITVILDMLHDSGYASWSCPVLDQAVFWGVYWSTCNASVYDFIIKITQTNVL